MAAATYSVSQTTLYGPNGAGPDPGKVYGVLFSTGSSVDWPTALTSLSFPDGPVLTSISATSESLFNTNNEFSTIRALGRLYSDGNPVPWPTTAMGLYTDAPATAVSNSASSSTTATATSTTTTNTSVTSKASTSAAGSSGTSASKHPTPTSQPSSSHSSGLPTGAIAGIAIGCALAGLVVGLVAAFCFFRRKGQRRRSVDHVVLHHEPKTYVTDDATVTHDLQLKQFMLEATPDRDIVQETESIGALIEQHVETYYHAEPLRADTRILVSALMQLGFSTSNSPASLDAQHATALCIHPRSRQVGLRHVIMRVLFSNIDTKSPHSPSLLPAPVASFIRAIPSAENDRLNDSQANAMAFREWRKLSAFLLHPARSQRTSLPASESAVVAQTEVLVEALNSFLGIFVDQRYTQQQVGHLQAVMGEGAKLGYMLFSHPSDWEFIFDAGAAKKGVVVEAGLCKLGGHSAPQRLLEPVVVSL